MDRRQKVLDFIVRYKREHDGNSPTRREIGEACQISSTSVVNYYLDQLARAGLIETARKARAITVMGGSWRINGS